MDRREALKRTAMVMGVAISASTITAIMSGCKTEAAGGVVDSEWKPSFFNKDQINAIAEIAERIIPRTDTPGAKDVGVHQFIDLMMNDNFTPEDQKAFAEDLTKFMTDVKSKTGKAFVELSASEQDEALTAIEANAIEALRNNSGEVPFFTRMKELTCIGFFTSEEGATQVLQYAPVPGDYKACISLEEAGGRTWAT